MSKPIVLGLGEYLWDMLPTGKKAGGAPVNFTYHASQNGAKGWAVSAIGDDELGRELDAVARDHGINLAVSKVDYPTSTVKVTIKDGQPNYEICEGVAWDHIPVTEQNLSLARKAAAISFGTLAQRSAQSRETTRTLVCATPSDALRIYDINLRQHFYSKELIAESLKISNVFKVNDDEILVLADLFGHKELSTDELCRWFIAEYSLKYLILTGGDKFSSIYYGDKVSTIATPKVELVDAVGAGDAFSGAFTGAILSGKSVPEAHRTAVEVAAYICTQAGARTPPRQ